MIINYKMIKGQLKPDYIFEASWEVCNKVGGIYTVLSTHAKTLQEEYTDRILFIGPDLWQGKEHDLFIESDTLFPGWKQKIREQDGIAVRTGRWNIPGTPIVILVDFTSFFPVKDEIYTKAWELYGVDSLHAYGDYDEASMFSYAAGKTVESFYRTYLNDSHQVVYQAHEWMAGLGALFLKTAVPEIATVFTTHATSVGRSIAGNNKPLYDYLTAYNGDQMAQELNIQSKHSIEKQTAHQSDCFTTVSEITGRECEVLLEKQPDAILMNGFENDFVPKGAAFVTKRRKARKVMLGVANKLLGTEWGDDTLIVATSGRYEFRNKGIDVFLNALNCLKNDPSLERNVLAFINVPAWVSQAREDLKERLKNKLPYTNPADLPFITHWLHNMEQDQVLGMLRNLGMNNAPEDRVKVVFVPCYLDGKDGIFDLSYYDLILGNDLSIYPSYYEPWGYTPLESIAFRVPAVTTDLAGFGLWIRSLNEASGGIENGTQVVHRSDDNDSSVAGRIAETVAAYASKNATEVKRIRDRAARTSEKALWKHFIRYYHEAYDIALRNARKRLSND